MGPYKEAWAKEKELRDAEVKADNLPRVLLKTNKGDIVIELFENQAPNTVANFISLVRKGFLQRLAFHRVLPGFMAQGGDPTGNGSGGPGYSIACECYRPDHRLHFRGSFEHGPPRPRHGRLAILPHLRAHLAPERQAHRVSAAWLKGMDVLAKLQRRDPDDPEAPQPDKIVEAKVIRSAPASVRAEKDARVSVAKLPSPAGRGLG